MVLRCHVCLLYTSRTKELYESGVVAQSAFEAAQTTLSNAEAALHSAKISAQQNLDSAKSRLDNAQESYKSAQLNNSAKLDEMCIRDSSSTASAPSR